MSKSHSDHHAAHHYSESATKHHRAAELEYGSGDHKKATLGALLTHMNAKFESHRAEVAAAKRAEHTEHHGMVPADEAADAAAESAPAAKAEPAPKTAQPKLAMKKSVAKPVVKMAPKAKATRKAARAR